VTADDKVHDALAHWAPRFLANGVDPNDLQRLASGITSWAGWCPAWCQAGLTHEELGREALAEARRRSAGEHLSRAAVYYHFAKFLLVEDREQMRQTHARALRCLLDALPHLDPPGQRIEIPFMGSRLAGVLRMPAGPGPHPVVVLVAGLDSTKEELGSTERSFLARNLATFSVDGPGQGEAEYELPIQADWGPPGAAILDALAARGDMDARRLGVWGISLGGYYAARWAAADPRVRACITLGGPFDLGEAWAGLPQLTRDAFRARSGATSEQEARAAAGSLSLEGWATRINCPLLVVAGKQDRIFHWSQAARLAEEASGPTTMLLLEEGNHTCANIVYRHRPRSADWMARQLSA
jgi:dienelactone hydrolase